MENKQADRTPFKRRKNTAKKEQETASEEESKSTDECKLMPGKRNHRGPRQTSVERVGEKTITAFPCTEILFEMEDKQRFTTSGERRKGTPVGLTILRGQR